MEEKEVPIFLFLKKRKNNQDQIQQEEQKKVKSTNVPTKSFVINNNMNNNTRQNNLNNNNLNNFTKNTPRKTFFNSNTPKKTPVTQTQNKKIFFGEKTLSTKKKSKSITKNPQTTKITQFYKVIKKDDKSITNNNLDINNTNDILLSSNMNNINNTNDIFLSSSINDTLLSNNNNFFINNNNNNNLNNNTNNSNNNLNNNNLFNNNLFNNTSNNMNNNDLSRIIYTPSTDDFETELNICIENRFNQMFSTKQQEYQKIISSIKTVYQPLYKLIGINTLSLEPLVLPQKDYQRFTLNYGTSTFQNCRMINTIFPVSTLNKYLINDNDKLFNYCLAPLFVVPYYVYTQIGDQVKNINYLYLEKKKNTLSPLEKIDISEKISIIEEQIDHLQNHYIFNQVSTNFDTDVIHKFHYSEKKSIQSKERDIKLNKKKYKEMMINLGKSVKKYFKVIDEYDLLTSILEGQLEEEKIEYDIPEYNTFLGETNKILDRLFDEYPEFARAPRNYQMSSNLRNVEHQDWTAQQYEQQLLTTNNLDINQQREQIYNLYKTNEITQSQLETRLEKLYSKNIESDTRNFLLNSIWIKHINQEQIDIATGNQHFQEEEEQLQQTEQQIIEKTNLQSLRNMVQLLYINIFKQKYLNRIERQLNSISKMKTNIERTIQSGEKKVVRIRERSRLPFLYLAMKIICPYNVTKVNQNGQLIEIPKLKENKLRYNLLEETIDKYGSLISNYKDQYTVILTKNSSKYMRNFFDIHNDNQIKKMERSHFKSQFQTESIDMIIMMPQQQTQLKNLFNDKYNLNYTNIMFEKQIENMVDATNMQIESYLNTEKEIEQLKSQLKKEIENEKKAMEQQTIDQGLYRRQVIIQGKKIILQGKNEIELYENRDKPYMISSYKNMEKRKLKEQITNNNNLNNNNNITLTNNVDNDDNDRIVSSQNNSDRPNNFENNNLNSQEMYWNNFINSSQSKVESDNLSQEFKYLQPKFDSDNLSQEFSELNINQQQQSEQQQKPHNIDKQEEEEYLKNFFNN